MIDNERMAANMKRWGEIVGDVSRNRLLGVLQDCDKEIALSEAQWEFVQRHNLELFPYRGQAINFAESCIQHALKRELAQIRKIYGPKTFRKIQEDDETSWTTQVSPSTFATPPLEEIAAPEPAQEDPRIAAFEEISPIAAQIYLCYSEGYSRQETAKIMSVSPAQILYDLKKAGHEANRQRNQPALFRIPVSEIRKKSVKKLGRPTKAAQAAATQQQISMF